MNLADARRRASRGTSRRSPSTSTPSRATARVAQLRVLRRPHRGAALRDGRRRLRAGAPPTTSSRHGSRRRARRCAAGAAGFATSSSPTHNGDGGRPVPSPARRPRRARARSYAAARARHKGVAALTARREDQARRHLRRSSGGSAGRSPGPRCSRSRASRGTRRSWPSEHGAARRGRRGVAAGLVPPARRSR